MNGKLEIGNGDLPITGKFIIDSRLIGKGDIFVAILGEHFDGDNFIEQAFKSGASICIGRQPKKLSLRPDQAYITVSDGVKALQKLAVDYRKSFAAPFVGVTGSNGKTSVKEMIYHLLSGFMDAAKNPGNKNGQLGVPLSILSMKPSNEVYVLEAGISMPDEMKKIAPIINPHIAVFTNVGPVHIEFFNNELSILEEKGVLFKTLKENDFAILFGDDPRLRNFAKSLNCHTTFFGFNASNHIIARNVKIINEAKMFFDVLFKRLNVELHFETNQTGIHNVINIIAAIATVLHFGIDFSLIEKKLISFEALAQRQEYIRLKNRILIINDSYNASPLSMKAALEHLSQLKEYNRRIAILGEMLELGDKTVSFHEEVGLQVVQNGIDFLITVGKAGKWIGEGAIKGGLSLNKYIHYDDKEILKKKLNELVNTGDVMLVKASRDVALETVIPDFAENIGIVS